MTFCGERNGDFAVRLKTIQDGQWLQVNISEYFCVTFPQTRICIFNLVLTSVLPPVFI
jgi:hypothetical protein